MSIETLSRGRVGPLVFVMVACACGDSTLNSLGQLPERPEIIDDLEDGDDRIPSIFRRTGGWYTFNDGTGRQCPGPWFPTPSPEVMASQSNVEPIEKFVAFTSGGGFEDWGAGLGISLAPLSVAYKDAAKYRGIRFLIKGQLRHEDPEQPDGELRINFPTTETSCAPVCPTPPSPEPSASSKTPTAPAPSASSEIPTAPAPSAEPPAAPAPSASREIPVAPALTVCKRPQEPPCVPLARTDREEAVCDNHFGRALELQPEWQVVEVLFGRPELRRQVRIQPRRFVPAPQTRFRPAGFRDVQFLVPPRHHFELWVDNVEFIP